MFRDASDDSKEIKSELIDLPDEVVDSDGIEELPSEVSLDDKLEINCLDAKRKTADTEFRNGLQSDSKEKNVDTEETNETEDYYSTYDERIKQTPKEVSSRGEWEGERGESEFIPYDQEIKEILEKYGLDGITYKDGIPDFSDVSESTVEIDNMSDNRADNFRQCDEKCAEQWNKEKREGRTDWTARDVAQWRKENGYTWHERNDMKTCDLIPTKINDYFGHLGGVSECRKRDSVNDGGDFDE